VTDYEFHFKRIEQSSNELKNRRDHLIEQIKSAFSGVTRSGGISLREARVIDDYGTEEERAKARSLETDSHWSEVDVEGLDPGGSCLNFIDPIGYRYYVPAYMSYALTNAYPDALGDPWVDSNCFDHLIYSLNATIRHDPDRIAYQRKRYSLFTTKECTSIARFLAFDAECVMYEDETDSIDALKNEWIGYLPHSELKHIQSIWPSAFS